MFVQAASSVWLTFSLHLSQTVITPHQSHVHFYFSPLCVYCKAIIIIINRQQQSTMCLQSKTSHDAISIELQSCTLTVLVLAIQLGQILQMLVTESIMKFLATAYKLRLLYGRHHHGKLQNTKQIQFLNSRVLRLWVWLML